MTIYRNFNETDHWTPNEVHATKFSDGKYFVMAKLKNGRIASYFFLGEPEEGQEQKILAMLHRIDRWNRIKEWVGRIRHLFCCDHD